MSLPLKKALIVDENKTDYVRQVILVWIDEEEIKRKV